MEGSMELLMLAALVGTAALLALVRLA